MKHNCIRQLLFVVLTYSVHEPSYMAVFSAPIILIAVSTIQAVTPEPHELIVIFVVSMFLSLKIYASSLSDFIEPSSALISSWKGTLTEPEMWPLLRPGLGSFTSPLNLGGALASVIYHYEAPLTM